MKYSARARNLKKQTQLVVVLSFFEITKQLKKQTYIPFSLFSKTFIMNVNKEPTKHEIIDLMNDEIEEQVRLMEEESVRINDEEQHIIDEEV